VKAAVDILRRDLEPGDVVLLKGRDTEHLERVDLALAGKEVGCKLVHCDARMRCSACPMLAARLAGAVRRHVSCLTDIRVRHSRQSTERLPQF
jgi:hypothetical protein